MTLVFYLKRKLSQRYFGAAHFRNIGAIKHFTAYLIGSFGHTGGDLKEIERKHKSKVKYKFQTESVQLFVAVLFLEFFGPDFGCSCTGPVASNTTKHTTYSPLRINSTWVSRKYVNVWSYLALVRGKMVFPSPNVMTVHSLTKVKRICGDEIYAEKGMKRCRRWPPIKKTNLSGRWPFQDGLLNV